MFTSPNKGLVEIYVPVKKLLPVAAVDCCLRICSSFDQNYMNSIFYDFKITLL